MTTRAKLISGIVASTILATSASAYMGMQGGKGMRGGMDCDFGNCNMHQGKGFKNKGYCGKMGYNKKGAGQGFLALVGQLNLTADQEKEIRDIMQGAMKDRESKFSAFSEKSFDKDKYVENRKNARDEAIQRRADTIEKVYSVLDSEQKKQLKVLMDLRDDRMANKRGMR